MAQNATFVVECVGRNSLNQPFLLSSVPSEVVESIANYRRYCGRSQWEKAFKQLDALSSAKPGGLVPGPDGVMVPPSQLVVRLISDLPADGKKAFQLFYDADAKNLLDQAQGSVEDEKLSTVATRYLFTASGDAAADRWGDLCFEKGRFCPRRFGLAQRVNESVGYHDSASAIVDQSGDCLGAGQPLARIRRPQAADFGAPSPMLP